MNQRIQILFLLFIFPTWALGQHPHASHFQNQALTGYYEGSIAAVNTIQKIVETNAPIKAAPIASGNYIVIGNTDGILFCLDTLGNLHWSTKTENSIEATALLLKQTVFQGDLSGNLYAFDLLSGKQKWKYTADNQIMGAPNWFVRNGDTCILAGSYDYYLHCIDAKTGLGVWKYELDNYLNGTVAVKNERIVFGGCDGYIHVVNSNDGTRINRYDVATYIAGSPCIFGDFACTGDYDGGITCVHLPSGKQAWQYKKTENNLPFVSGVACHEGLIFIGSYDKHAYCFDARIGTLRWTVNTGMKIEAAPIIAKNGVLFLNARGELWFLNPENGHVIWKFDLGIMTMNSPAVINSGL
ncbi:MAG: hypothetical protein EOL88_07790, partial [Bacteroidia bacterium]|nr:hypothetical protein [Bacteroidia bacterium]